MWYWYRSCFGICLVVVVVVVFWVVVGGSFSLMLFVVFGGVVLVFVCYCLMCVVVCVGGCVCW